MRPEVMVRIPLPSAGLKLLEEDFVVHYAPSPEEFEKAIDAYPATRALVTNGSIGVTGDQLRRLRKLELVHTQGVGHENVDLAAVKELGLILCTGKGTNASSVADHAMALLLGIARNLSWADRQVRNGLWLKSRGPRALAYQKRLGILGLGEIGLQIAERALGFNMEIRYHNRNKRSDVPYEYKASPLELARDSDFIVIATPGGPGTKGIVNREFLDALGPKGFLINIGRGSIVDTDELVKALHEQRIAGAALDVVAGEPNVTQELLEAPNLIITPHMAGRSPETVSAAMQRISNNLKAHFANGELVSRVA
ncbi:MULTISPECIES: 2-hydroxyacid dehydrogenase [Chelativorans]|uniref:D-isomer specific 2-hydroxyacid dehydrogenase, NAD-binding protein n=1 Tax=Chelativorans sp. (strain BNC1) TaxID=266779 RepID=Q11JE8_CHESB|nr:MULTISPECIES: 2-hydroxyacid dehydrogenase [Chelativorans]